MNRDEIKKLLESVQAGRVAVDQALEHFAHLPYEDLTFARVDHHRELRLGFPEVIFGQGKTVEQITAIAERILEKSANLLVTRTTAVPGPFSVASSFSDRIVPTRPPGGMCPRICGNAGRRAKAAENVRTINAIPMARTMSLRTGQEASQQKP